MSTFIKKSKLEELSTGTIFENEHDLNSEWHELVVNSRDKENTNQSTHDFSVIVKDDMHRVDVVYFESVAVPPLYNIDATNNTMSLTHTGAGAGTFTATITSGAYSLTTGTVTLLSAIKTALDAAAGGGHTFTVTYNDNTYKITIAISGDAFYIDWAVSATADNILGEMLGFDVDASPASVASITSDNVVDVGIDELYIKIDELGTSYKNNTSNKVQWTFKVLLENDSFGTKNILYRPRQLGNQVKIFDAPVIINRLTVRVYDKYGNIKNFQGANWMFTLKYRERTV